MLFALCSEGLIALTNCILPCLVAETVLYEVKSWDYRRFEKVMNTQKQTAREVIGELSLEQLEALTEALLEFNSLQDLQQWLEAHS